MLTRMSLAVQSTTQSKIDLLIPKVNNMQIITTETKVSEFLMAGKAIIAEESAWVQNFYAKDKEGSFVSANNPEAVCFCSLGALNKVRGPLLNSWGTPASTLRILAEAVLSRAMGGSVPPFNDEHTHEEVMAAWDLAINMALANEVAV